HRCRSRLPHRHLGLARGRQARLDDDARRRRRDRRVRAGRPTPRRARGARALRPRRGGAGDGRGRRDRCAPRYPRRNPGQLMRVRVWVVAAVLLLACGGLAAAALIAWPQARLGATDDALARVELPAFAGRVTSVVVHSPDEAAIPVRLQRGNVWPLRTVGSGVSLTVAVTVTRPRWASWLVGKTERRSFTIVTPQARLRGRWLQVKTGAPVTISFDAPVRLVALGAAPPRRLVKARAVVPVGVIATGSESVGTI